MTYEIGKSFCMSCACVFSFLRRPFSVSIGVIRLTNYHYLRNSTKACLIMTINAYRLKHISSINFGL